MTVTSVSAERGGYCGSERLRLLRRQAAIVAERAAERFPPIPLGEQREAALRLAVAITSALAVTVGGTMANLGYIHSTGNIHAVEPGQFYRSATLSASTLKDLIHEKGIRTIVNLRGGEGRPWYEAERRIAGENGVEFVSFHISAKRIPERETLAEILFVLQNAPQPILIHCKSGSDRAGLISAIYEYAFAGKTAEEASRQLSFDYGHFPWLGSRTAAMGEAFAQFAAENPQKRPIKATERPEHASLPAR